MPSRGEFEENNSHDFIKRDIYFFVAILLSFKIMKKRDNFYIFKIFRLKNASTYIK